MWRSFTSSESYFFGDMIPVPLRCRLQDYPDRYVISDFWWKIQPSRWWYAAGLYIMMWGICEDIISLTILQYSLYVAKLTRVRGYLPETFYGCCRCLKNVFTAGSVSYGKTYVTPRIASTCGTSPKAPISDYNWWSSNNSQDPLVWW